MSRFIRKLFARVLTGGAFLLPLATPTEVQAQPVASAGAPVAKPMTSKELHQHLAHGAGWIRIIDDRGVRHGTGWILDREQKLMITNNHVVDGYDEVLVTFPIWKDGKLVTAESGYQNAPKIKAAVIDRDPFRDLAVIKVDSIPDGMHELKLAAAEPDEGDDIRLIGGFTAGGDGLVWGAVTGVVRASGPQEVDLDQRRRVRPLREVLSDARTNGGNSGAPVVNMAGEVVAVHFAYKSWAHNVVRHVSVLELKDYLKEVAPIIEPKTAEQFLTRAQRRLNTGRIDKAISDASAALSKDSKLVGAMLVRGSAFLLKKDAQTAIEDFNDALKLEPDSYDIRVARGRAYRAAKKDTESLGDFSAAIRSNPEKPTAYNERGLTHFFAGRFAEAESDFSRAVEISPKDVNLLTNRADARSKQKKFAEAAADWAKASELAPWNAFYASQLGFALQSQGKFDAAAQAFARAVDITNGAPLYWGCMADALRLGGKFEAAVKGFTKALDGRKALEDKGVKLSPADTALDYSGRAQARIALKQYREAVDDLTKAIELTDRKVAVYFVLRADALEGLGEKGSAASDRETATKLGFKFEEANGEKPPANVGAGAEWFVGTWTGVYAVNGVKVTEVITMNADGTFDAVFVTVAFGVTERTTDTGTWTVNKNGLSFKAKRLGNVTRAYEKGENAVKIAVKEFGIVVTFKKD